VHPPWEVFVDAGVVALLSRVFVISEPGLSYTAAGPV